MNTRAIVLAGSLWCALGLPLAAQQQVTVTAPMQRIDSAFAGGSSVNWSAGGPNWSFQFRGRATTPFGQCGSNRSIVGAATSLTLTPGVPSHFFSGELRPFVTGVRPVVGDDPIAAAAAMQRQQQIALMIEANAKQHSDQLRRALRRAELAEQDGDLKTARANYRRAFSLAAPPLRLQIQQRVQAMAAAARRG